MEFIDPVCGMTVDDQSAAGKSTHEGRDYYFCNTGCKVRFDENPKEFLRSDQQR